MVQHRANICQSVILCIINSIYLDYVFVVIMVKMGKVKIGDQISVTSVLNYILTFNRHRN